MSKVFRCKEEYIDDCGFICFNPEKEYIFIEERWSRIFLFDNYSREVGVFKENFFTYFYTDVQNKAKKRKEVIAKLNF